MPQALTITHILSMILGLLEFTGASWDKRYTPSSSFIHAFGHKTASIQTFQRVAHEDSAEQGTIDEEKAAIGGSRSYC